MPEQLTAQRIKKIRPPDTGRIEITDSVARGLVFRCTSAGTKTWSLSIRVDGRQRRFPVGEFPALSLADARLQAGTLRAAVLSGRDPIEERRSRRGAEHANLKLTLGTVLGRYNEMHLTKLKDGQRRHAQLTAALKPHIERSIQDLTRANLQAAIDDKAISAPGAANRLKAALVHFSNWTRKRGYIEDRIAEELEAPTKERPRERVLSLDEIGRIWAASHGLGQLFGPVIRLLILTAQRRGDVAGIRISELKNDRWELPGERTKNGRPHIVHLSEAARRELPVLPNDADLEDKLIFTTTGQTPVSGFGRIKERIDQMSGVNDWRLHDFRTAFASHCAEAGIPEGIVDRILNHSASASKASAVARVYQRSELLHQRAVALDRWAEMVTDAAQPYRDGL